MKWSFSGFGWTQQYTVYKVFVYLLCGYLKTEKKIGVIGIYAGVRKVIKSWWLYQMDILNKATKRTEAKSTFTIEV